MAKATSTHKVADATNIAKASAQVVAMVDEFAEVKAEIARLEKVKDALAKQITDAFGKTATVLTHYGVEVARLETRQRAGLDTDLLKKAFPEAYEAVKTMKPYQVIVNIFRKK